MHQNSVTKVLKCFQKSVWCGSVELKPVQTRPDATERALAAAPCLREVNLKQQQRKRRRINEEKERASAVDALQRNQDSTGQGFSGGDNCDHIKQRAFSFFLFLLLHMVLFFLRLFIILYKFQ